MRSFITRKSVFLNETHNTCEWIGKFINKLPEETWTEAFVRFLFENPYDKIKSMYYLMKTKGYWSRLLMSVKGERFVDYEYISWNLDDSVIDIIKNGLEIISSKDEHTRNDVKLDISNMLTIIDNINNLEQDLYWFDLKGEERNEAASKSYDDYSIEQKKLLSNLFEIFVNRFGYFWW